MRTDAATARWGEEVMFDKYSARHAERSEASFPLALKSILKKRYVVASKMLRSA